ncbi:MAG: hypothetical protein ACTSO2_18115 [Promethearchaeota archaeon]
MIFISNELVNLLLTFKKKFGVFPKFLKFLKGQNYILLTAPTTIIEAVDRDEKKLNNAYAFFVTYILGNVVALQECNKENILCIAKEEFWKYSNMYKIWGNTLFLYYPEKLKSLCLKMGWDPFYFFIYEFLDPQFLDKFCSNVPSRLEPYFADILYMAKYGAQFSYYLVPEGKKKLALKAIKLFFKKGNMDEELIEKLKFKIRTPRELIELYPDQDLYQLDLTESRQTFLGMEDKTEIKRPFIEAFNSIFRRLNEKHGKYLVESHILKKCPEKPMFFLMTPPVFVEILDYMALHGKVPWTLKKLVENGYMKLSLFREMLFCLDPITEYLIKMFDDEIHPIYLQPLWESPKPERTIDYIIEEGYRRFLKAEGDWIHIDLIVPYGTRKEA